MTTQEFANDLRALADWYEKHPDAPVPVFPVLNIFTDQDAVNAKAQFRALGGFEKRYLGEWFAASKTFGSIRLELNAKREQICRKVVVGTREIPEHVIPAQAETIIPAHVEEITEWQCEPILTPEDNYPTGVEGLTTPPSEAEVEL